MFFTQVKSSKKIENDPSWPRDRCDDHFGRAHDDVDIHIFSPFLFFFVLVQLEISGFRQDLISALREKKDVYSSLKEPC